MPRVMRPTLPAAPLDARHDVAADGSVRVTSSMRCRSDVPARDTVVTHAATDLGYPRRGRVTPWECGAAR